MVMKQITPLFTGGIVLVVLGILAFVITYVMLPIQIQAQADLLNPTISGVTLTTSQGNLVTSMGNLAILLLLLVPIVLVMAGVILMFVSAFKGGK